MLQNVDLKTGTPKFRNVYLNNITATNAGTCMKVTGIKTGTIDNFEFKNVHFEGKEAGSINWANDWSFTNFSIKTDHDEKLHLNNCKNVKLNK
ncbi:MAG: hypothetical protein LLF95_00320 [Bacteroidales bacterium]|nr:hypothetical protein [Bacteroidales bacterium]